jgi:hypothetical protein
MPGCENVLGGVDVTVVYRSTFAASPFSYSKTFPAFRASAPVTAATGLGGIRLIDLLEPHACDIALILQHGPECTPARVENRFGLVRLRKGGGIHVANEERTIASNKPGAEFVMKVFSTVRNLGVDRPDPTFLVCALGTGPLCFQLSIVLLRLNDRAIAGGCKILQPRSIPVESSNSASCCIRFCLGVAQMLMVQRPRAPSERLPGPRS